MSRKKNPNSQPAPRARLSQPNSLTDAQLSAASGGSGVGGWSVSVGNGYCVVGTHDEGTQSSHYVVESCSAPPHG